MTFEKAVKIKFAVFLALIIFSCIPGCTFSRNPGLDRTQPAHRLNLSGLEDGIFRGTHFFGEDEFKVDVTVVKHTVKCIEIINEKHLAYVKKCALCKANSLIEEILNEQSIEADVVSGATITGSVLVEAIQDALTPPFDRMPIKDGNDCGSSISES